MLHPMSLTPVPYLSEIPKTYLNEAVQIILIIKELF